MHSSMKCLSDGLEMYRIYLLHGAWLRVAQVSDETVFSSDRFGYL